jgi:hypothetical protein
MTPQEITTGILVWVCFFVLYFLRKTPPFNIVWKYTMLFLVVLFGTILYNKWKEKK